MAAPIDDDRQATIAGGNPLKTDPELKALLDKLDFVKTYRAFQRWRQSFRTRFESFLEQAGIDNADQAYRHFQEQTMDAFVKLVAKMQGYMDKGELSSSKATVKARQCLSEFSKQLTSVIEEEDGLIPSTISLEKEKGYNKFHMGAVLVRDGFEEYGRLSQCNDLLQHWRKGPLAAVADKQILEEMDNYRTKLTKFCDVMADLGLYQVMLKCREFAVEQDDLEALIFLDMKTGGIGELSRQLCLEKQVVTSRGVDESGNDLFYETAADDETKDRLLKMIKESPKLGVGFGNSTNNYDEEIVSVAEADKIRNMWGVTLRKTPKNKKGEELVFVCRKTGAFGEISRKGCLEKEVLTETKDENGKVVLGEAHEEFEERAHLVEVLRGVLSLGVDSTAD